MLPREHRLTRGADFRRVMRRGARSGAEGMVVAVHLVPIASQTGLQSEAQPGVQADGAHQETPSSAADAPDAVATEAATSLRGTYWRCGLIVAKTVGNAVVRHRTQRRLRHLMRVIIEAPDGPLSEIRPQASVTGDRRVDVVIRALPEITALDHPALREQLTSALRRALSKAVRGAAGTGGSRKGREQR